MQSQLGNILRCMVKRNAKIGYAQGMNVIAAHLLTVIGSEEYAFWTLCQIMECYLPLDYFSNFFGVAIDQKVLEEFVEKLFPELAAHFYDIGFSLDMLSLSWFV